ncbi:MAG: hypothetical protein AVDCRST_MAG28-3614 [uncultured Rubrobacteraceae bacterium]|uniref:Uncharacterized protein n=1 Tax=uncultured Rubrobacteraceae bacterium TaxID=349277 RepID=A0A6J4R4Z5_9ACTN|nr:MAG: hypothetical protein AVDCRST_MAG28-3614 [uncultured Rubrobacteraceae bacterium]
MGRQEIEHAFANAGWDLDDCFTDVLIIGCSGDSVSLLAHEEAWRDNESVFEILDHKRIVGRWVREIPTPQQAQELLARLCRANGSVKGAVDVLE